jgi:hypothetical protein
VPKPGSEQQQQNGGDAAPAAAAAAGGSDTSAAAAAAAMDGSAGRTRSTRHSTRQQQQRTVLGGAGGLVTVKIGSTLDMSAGAAAAVVAAPGCEVQYEEHEDDEEVGLELPETVADMLSDVQSGRIAAAALILQAAEQQPNLPKDMPVAEDI